MKRKHVTLSRIYCVRSGIAWWLYWTILGAGLLRAGAGETDWQRHVAPNAAYLRAKQRPAFSMSDPAGLVASETVKTQQRQAADQLIAAIRGACEQGETAFAIPPGEYRFAENRGFAFDAVEDFTLVAPDVTFWFERPASMLSADPKGLELRNSRNVMIRGLKIDFDPPVFVQAKILDVDENEPGYVVEIDPDFPDAEMAGGSYFLYRADGSSIPRTVAGTAWYKSATTARE